jgi:hypothetical protein
MMIWVCLVLAAIGNVLYQWTQQQGYYSKDDGYFSDQLYHLVAPTAGGHSSATKRVVNFPFDKDDTSSTVAVFYHIFFPPHREGQENSARIIQEQLQQLWQSTQQKSQQHLRYVVYYNTIGTVTEHLNNGFIQTWCTAKGLKCIPMEHYAEGLEDKTLQRLHDYCTTSQNSSPQTQQQVMYIHNKGSFTVKPINEAWRYHMTQAVSSPQCHDALTTTPTSNNPQCNVCGLFFSAERGMFMAGNMWTSTCGYVKDLLPLQEFSTRIHEVTKEALLERLRYKLLMTLQELRAGVFGIDRYATEFWIASHPTIQPCDFAKAVEANNPNIKADLTDSFLQWLRNMKTNYQMPLVEEWFNPQAPYFSLKLSDDSAVMKYDDVRLREYFLLAGNVYKWYALYQQAPPMDSWVYQWFPDGPVWQKAIQDHGNRSVDVITTQALQQEAESHRNRYTSDKAKQDVTKSSESKNTAVLSNTGAASMTGVTIKKRIQQAKTPRKQV